MSALVEEQRRIPVGTRSVNAHFFYPAGAGPYPGILFLMEFYGVRSWVLADARDLAAEGYAVLVPDLYSEMGRLRFCIRQFFYQAGRTNANETRQEALREVFAILEHLKTLPAVDAERLGALGQCLTGGFALHWHKFCHRQRLGAFPQAQPLGMAASNSHTTEPQSFNPLWERSIR